MEFKFKSYEIEQVQLKVCNTVNIIETYWKITLVYQIVKISKHFPYFKLDLSSAFFNCPIHPSNIFLFLLNWIVLLRIWVIGNLKFIHEILKPSLLLTKKLSHLSPIISGAQLTGERWWDLAGHGRLLGLPERFVYDCCLIKFHVIVFGKMSSLDVVDMIQQEHCGRRGKHPYL